jgi:FkbM family methyltransferase
MTKSTLLNAIRKALFVGTPLEKPLRSFVRGSSIGSFRSKFLPNHDLFPKNSPRVLSREGRELTLNIGEWMEWSVYFEIDDPTERAIQDLLKPGDVALDIGSNIGSMILAMSRKVKSEGRVFGFEPSQNRYQKCIERLRFENMANAHVANVALGAKPGLVSMASPDPSNLGRTRVTYDLQTVPSVQCVTLDQWVLDAALAKVDFIKMDVEGFECEVLQGAHATLNRFKPILFIEVDDVNLREQGSSAHQLVQTIRDLRYRISSAQGHDLSETLPDHFDLIARPQA